MKQTTLLAVAVGATLAIAGCTSGKNSNTTEEERKRPTAESYPNKEHEDKLCKIVNGESTVNDAMFNVMWKLYTALDVTHNVIPQTAPWADVNFIKDAREDRQKLLEKAETADDSKPWGVDGVTEAEQARKDAEKYQEEYIDGTYLKAIKKFCDDPYRENKQVEKYETVWNNDENK